MKYELLCDLNSHRCRLTITSPWWGTKSRTLLESESVHKYELQVFLPPPPEKSLLSMSSDSVRRIQAKIPGAKKKAEWTGPSEFSVSRPTLFIFTDLSTTRAVTPSGNPARSSFCLFGFCFFFLSFSFLHNQSLRWSCKPFWATTYLSWHADWYDQTRLVFPDRAIIVFH